MAAQKVLIIEDEPKQARLLKDYLDQSGFESIIIDRGDEAASRVRRENPAAVLLDLNLPGADGLTVCREIRSFSQVPILMVTARVDEIDRLLGLELGADDYICKPFSPREVVARMKAVLRRTGPTVEATVLIAGRLSLDQGSRRVTADGIELDLTPSEFDLMALLMSRPGQVFSRGRMVERLQGVQFEGYERTIDSHIKNLRKKITLAAPDYRPIDTVYGVGYRLEPDQGK